VSYGAAYARGASDSYIHNGEKPAMSLIQVFHPIVGFNLLLALQELDMGVLQHMATLQPREGQTREVLKQTGWNLREEAKLRPLYDECLTPSYMFSDECYNLEL